MKTSLLLQMDNTVWGEIYFSMKKPASFTPEVNWNVHSKKLNDTHYEIISKGVQEGYVHVYCLIEAYGD